MQCVLRVRACTRCAYDPIPLMNRTHRRLGLALEAGFTRILTSHLVICLCRPRGLCLMVLPAAIFFI